MVAYSSTSAAECNRESQCHHLPNIFFLFFLFFLFPLFFSSLLFLFSLYFLLFTFAHNTHSIRAVVIMSGTNSDTESRPGSRSRLPPNAPPQQGIDKFWKSFTTKHPGKLFTVLPDNLYAKRAAIQASRKAGTSKNAVASYEQAAATCTAKVNKIVQDCRRLNQKYKDPHFDIEFDFMQWQWYQRTEDCLVPLDADRAHLRPMSVKRIEVCQGMALEPTLSCSSGLS